MNRKMTKMAAVGVSLTLLLSACSAGASRDHVLSGDSQSPFKSQSSEASLANQQISVNSAAVQNGQIQLVALNKQSAAVKDMLKLAAKGRVAHSQFAVEKGLIDDVEKAWGKPDKTDQAGKGMYATYAKRHIVFGYNKGMQIFDVRSDHADVQKLTLSEVTKALGKTKDVRSNGNDAIYVYKAGKDYELKFVMPKPTKKTPNPHIHHISVFYPSGAVNLMAGDDQSGLEKQNGIEAGVDQISSTLTDSDSATRSFQFFFGKTPAGYSLSRMEWKTKTSSVQNSYEQAKENGENGNLGFYISGNGQFSGYFYEKKSSGEKGTLILTFKDSKGKSLTWQKGLTLN